jgi:tetratricopeptide (TPR) repeat protein
VTKERRCFSWIVHTCVALVCAALPLSARAQTSARSRDSVSVRPSTSPARNLEIPPEVTKALDKIYSGDPDGAMPVFRQLQQREPGNPLGYILEAEARWWKIYCASSTVKWGMVNAWKRGPQRGDNEYLALLDREIDLSNGAIAQHDSAEMRLYAGIGLAMKAQLYGLQGGNHATAHSAVAARREFLRAVQMNPNLADAYTGLGLYNYYVDTLAPVVKVLRFLMGIPGGNRELGIQQLERGMKDGQLTAVDARFYLATNLRTYDHDYQRALTIAQPLAARYPGNPIFLLVIGNLQQELGNHAPAAATFHAAGDAPIHDSACAARVRQLAGEMPASR